jgi:hypothetical protein
MVRRFEMNKKGVLNFPKLIFEEVPEFPLAVYCYYCISKGKSRNKCPD